MAEKCALPAGAGAGGPVNARLAQSTVFRIYDGVPITWSIDQCEEMSSIVLGEVDAEELRLDFFSLEALDRFVTAAKQARQRLRMRITATEQAIAAGYAGTAQTEDRP